MWKRRGRRRTGSTGCTLQDKGDQLAATPCSPDSQAPKQQCAPVLHRGVAQPPLEHLKVGACGEGRAGRKVTAWLPVEGAVTRHAKPSLGSTVPLEQPAYPGSTGECSGCWAATKPDDCNTWRPLHS